MYILMAPQNQTTEMLKLLKDFDVMSLPLIDLEFSIDKINYVEKNINNFDYVILTSPSAINKLNNAINQAHNTCFMTVGLQSANKIKQLTKNEVIYPENIDGRDALFKDKIPLLDFSNKKVLLIKGSDAGFYNEIINRYPNWEVLDIYKRVHLIPENKELLKKLLTDRAVKGIIITTSILVDELFKLIDILGCRVLLQNIPFIVIHPKIRSALEQYGIKNILMTNSTNKREIADLIRSLNV